MSIISKVLLCGLAIVFLLLGGLLLADSLGKMQASPQLLTVAAIVPVFAGVAVLILGVCAGIINLGGIYSPEGKRIDTTHVWVEVITGKRVGPATERQVYEKYHGQGSWARMVATAQKVLSIIGLIVALLGTGWLLMTILNQTGNPVIGSFLSLAGSRIWDILVFLLIAACTGAVLFSCLYIWGAGIPPFGKSPFDYEMPSSTLVFLSFLPALVILLAAIFIHAYAWLPAFQTEIPFSYFRGAVAILYLGLGLHWLAVAFPPRYRMSKEYRSRQDRRDGLVSAFKLLQDSDCDKKMRIAIGIELLHAPELTNEARAATIRIMEIISGEHYGGDVKRWEEYNRHR